MAHQPEVVKDFPAGCPVVLTPNMIEFARLQVCMYVMDGWMGRWLNGWVNGLMEG